MRISKIPSQCKKIKFDGSKCQAYRISESTFCFWHSPKMKAKRIEARKKGGQNRRKNKGEDFVTYKITTNNDIQKLLEKAINDLIRGKISASEARALVHQLHLAIKIQSIAEFERDGLNWEKMFKEKD